MRETQQLVATLKRFMKARGMTYRRLAHELKISEASVKRVFSEHTFTLERLEKVCTALDLSLYELTRMARLGEGHGASVLSLEQEQALAADQLLLAYFYLLINGWRPGRIAGHFGVSKAQHTGLLTKLDRLQLIRLLPRNQVVLVTARTIDWLPRGPVRTLYERIVTQQFMQCEFASKGESRRFVSAELTQASAEIIARKVERLIREFDELAELDMSLPATKKAGVGLLVAQRPWAFWEILAQADGLKKKARTKA